MLTGFQKVSQTDRLEDRQGARQTDIMTVSSFQLSYQNSSCSECQQDVRKIESHADRQTDIQTERLTKVVQNVNTMSKIERQTHRQTDRKTDDDNFKEVIL